MKRIAFITTVLALLFFANISRALCQSITGAWCGSILGSRIEVTLVQNDQMFEGIANLTDIMGTQSTYHVVGAVFGNAINGLHGSGHTFAGQLVNPDIIKGTLTLKSGRQFDLELERVHAATVSQHSNS
ncbi:hypothetical protein [Desulfovibrio inopinatus]|uniref:hypothetical protein n=1 Tax=Desulfovibrio inopinatus TaxID=102109 RepID=UPI0004283DEF|nr:hypothetical protein [Desulfovibrio inopinatus]